ncbi:protein tyrosine phosphatase family protein [Dendronalium sp. ChiSLP03b]|uniref:protein tyrosine phosphatase family protein n=1 Tax=Dendronalium sp. ChiSLP03b TaxID=3075381 RepID=UPI002AD4A3ED|nr:protein tyrosine phosphatase family protein [Dendronalium sp. ChiSLP03b]MDZ8206473.1 protein tyrosine phosphatase family protein [Dendronalium sp. ChiSLP03b]
MINTKKIGNDLSSAGQPTPEQLQQAAIEGFKSVINLRLNDEQGFLSNEQQQAETAGLQYAHIPLKSTEPDQELTKAALQEIADLPKPILIHCAAGARASGIALIANAIHEGLTYEQITQKATDLGISLEQPHLKQFLLEKYSTKQVEKS